MPDAARAPRWELPADRAELRFEEKYAPLSDTEAAREAVRCLYCVDAPCIRACPTAIDVPTFIRKIGTGNLRGAARTILSANLLGASCARVCPVEVLCEGACVYTADGRPPIAIGRLQRHALDHGGGVELLERRPPTGRSVGLVGAGPASLACAATLALRGHSPVVYEKRALPGGLNTTGVAPYKQLAHTALLEAEDLLGLGVELRTGVEVGVQVGAAELLARHDALFLGVGLGEDSRLGVPGEEGPGVVGAVAWIERMKNRPGDATAGIRSAVVIGGGNTALDAARELRGLGVPSVTLAYRRARAEMKGYAHELAAALSEGVVLCERVAVSEVRRVDGNVTAVQLVATEDGRPTGFDAGALPTDLVVLAIGQAKLTAMATLFEGVAVDERGRIVADPKDGRTGNPRIFAGGDARNGGKEVVNAAAEGQAAARAIDALLRGGAAAATPGGRP